jgi:hypothetical protein
MLDAEDIHENEPATEDTYLHMSSFGLDAVLFRRREVVPR